MSEINIGGTLCVWSDCITCGVRYTVPKTMWDHQREQGGEHHCPNGHKQGWFKGGTEIDKLRRERDRLKQEQARLEDERREADARAAKAERQAHNLKRRIGRGSCPCCKRSFANVQRHMATKHPEIATLPARIA